MPLFEVVGSAASAAPEQIGARAVKIGVMFGLTVIDNVVVVAHCPAVGVKVYSVVAVLFNAGLQVPLMPLVDVVGSAASTAPEQIGATAVKVGVTVGGNALTTALVAADVQPEAFLTVTLYVVLGDRPVKMPVVFV